MATAPEPQPEVSVIVVAYEAGERLLACARSVLEEEGGPTRELIVVDNGSRDGSAEALAAALPQATLIRNLDNRGFAAANNQGVAVARGRALLFLNDDAELRPGALAALLGHLDAQPDVVAVAPRLVWPDGRVQASNRVAPGFAALLHRVRWLRWTRLFRARYRAYRESFQDAAGPVACPAGAALMVRAGVVDPVWDAGYRFGLEDVDLALRLGEVGAVHHVPAAEVVHAGSLASDANTAFTYAGYEWGYARHLAKHGTHARLYALLIALDQPLRLVLQSGRVLLGLLRGGEARRREAGRWWAIARFLLTGLPGLWRASGAR